ncbi:MAG: M28 family peptidase [Bacillota bacterium]
MALLRILSCTLAALAAGCVSSPWLDSRLPPKGTLRTISPAELERHIATLSSDRFAGRAPGTAGEELTVGYVVEQFKRAGALPGNPDGTYRQTVPLVGIGSSPSAAFCVRGECKPWALNKDFVGGSLFLQSEVKVEDSQLVFVGFGLVDPLSGRDDYKDVDVRGKTLLMLSSEADVEGGHDAPGPRGESGGGFARHAVAIAQQREAAAAKGAAARVIIHDAADSHGALSTFSWSPEELDMEPRRIHHLPVSLRADEGKVRELLADAGFDLDALKRKALLPDFKPVALPVRANLDVRNTVRRFESSNIVARIEGSDPNLKDEYVVYVAHWDHLGHDPSLPDPVYHGALDNASGVAALLEMAKAYAHLATKPRRSILFLVTTGEENGLLGARHYVAHPLYPLKKTVGVLNLDTLNPWGPTNDFEIVGTATAALHAALIDVAIAQGRVLSADTRPDMGFFYRSDQLEFARVGVPSIWIRRGTNYIGRPARYGRDVNAAYFANDYHKPTDTARADWDYAGMADQVRFAFAAGYRLAMIE